MPGPGHERLSTLLNLSFPYDWSNSNIDENIFILRVLEDCFIEDIVKCVHHFGIQRVFSALQNIDDPVSPLNIRVIFRSAIALAIAVIKKS